MQHGRHGGATSADTGRSAWRVARKNQNGPRGGRREVDGGHPEVWELMPRPPSNRNSVSIRTGLHVGLQATTADRVQLQQVLMNLMLDGIEAMKNTGGERAVTAKSTEANKGRGSHGPTGRPRHDLPRYVHPSGCELRSSMSEAARAQISSSNHSGDSLQ
jgi:hypothetical protein